MRKKKRETVEAKKKVFVTFASSGFLVEFFFSLSDRLIGRHKVFECALPRLRDGINQQTNDYANIWIDNTKEN